MVQGGAAWLPWHPAATTPETANHGASARGIAARIHS